VSTKMTSRTSTRGRNVAKKTSTDADTSSVAPAAFHQADTHDTGTQPSLHVVSASAAAEDAVSVAVAAIAVCAWTAGGAESRHSHKSSAILDEQPMVESRCRVVPLHDTTLHLESTRRSLQSIVRTQNARQLYILCSKE